MANFLFEIGLEEVPARMIASAQAELARRVLAMLERERLVEPGTEVKSFATPRRLAVLVDGVSDGQQDLSEEVLGPAMKIAFKEGVAGPAAVAFAKKSGVEVSALRVVTTAKGDYVAATTVKPGRSAAEVIAAELPKELAGIYWAKNMYWRAGKPERFVRPVRWMVALLDAAVVPVHFAGCAAGRQTFGHRVLHGEAPIPLATPGMFVEALTKAFVMADVERRRHTIRKALDKVCRSVPGARWREDHALVDKMTHMTEWPSVIVGSFEAEYLTLPQEVLVTVMRDHQNYFALEKGGDTEGGRELVPHFLAVLNSVADEAGEAVIRHGNERVLRARFNDARFFWEFDQRVPLDERVALLEKVTFQKDLGSYAAKSERVARIALRLASSVKLRGQDLDVVALETALRLCKTDLTTELVKEFTELQGQIGGLYGLAQGVSATACDAMYDQYRPVSMEDRIPRTVEGQLLAIADKADTIAGMFSLGMEPTGSKDPFALRRAGNGIVKILAESNLPLTLGEIVAAVPSLTDQVTHSLNAFLTERLSFYLRESRMLPFDIVNAVLAADGARVDDVRDALSRAEAISVVRGSTDFEAVCSAFKRVKNILNQAREKQMRRDGAVVSLQAPSELALLREIELRGEEVGKLRVTREYGRALEEIAKFGPYLTAFFEEVMVLTDDEGLRAARLNLLDRVFTEFAQIADFSEIVTAG